MPKRVTWEDLKGADAELLDSEGQRRTWDARCWRRVTGKAQRCMEAACARGWQMLCPVVFTPRPRASNQPAERPMKSKGQILGYLWKLCAGVDMTPSELSKIQNWRRRLFFIEEVDRGLAMLSLGKKCDRGVALHAGYVSEKSDGSTALGWIFGFMEYPLKSVVIQ
ncbi:unnamed protein product [Effrenium voratum]|nr:unnamed protein product [Effrenium voratum]